MNLNCLAQPLIATGVFTENSRAYSSVTTWFLPSLWSVHVRTEWTAIYHVLCRNMAQTQGYE